MSIFGIGSNGGPPMAIPEVDVAAGPVLLYKCDFRAGDRFPFARNSVAWYYNSAGLIKQADLNVPRINYDPVTLVNLGWLVEEARTNFAIQSVAYTNAEYFFDSASVAAASITGPDGTTSGEVVTGTNASTTWADWGHLTTTGVAASANFAMSYFCHAAASNNTNFTAIYFAVDDNNVVCVVIDYTTGLSVSQRLGGTSGTLFGYGSIPQGNSGWYRTWACGKATGTYGTIQGQLVDAATPGGGYDPGFGQPQNTGPFTLAIGFWNNQIEQGDYPTSTIITTTAAVARAAEINSSTLAEIVGSSCIVVGFRTPLGIGQTATQTVWSINDGTANNRMELYRDASRNLILKVVSGGTTQLTLTVATAVADHSDHKCAINLVSGAWAASMDGGTVATGTGTKPSGLKFSSVGHDFGAANYLNGEIGYLASYLPATSPQLQSLST